MAYCLPKFAADILKTKFKSGEISPEKLSDMTSAERRQALSFLGEENAKQTNAMFESKLLLKNQQTAMVKWAQQILRMKPAALRDTLSRVEKMGEILQPKDLEMFLDDLVEKKLGIDVSVQEAGQLLDLSKKVESAKAQIDRSSPDGSPSRISYGLELRAFQKYVEGLKEKSAGLPMKEYLKIKNWPTGLLNLANTTKSVLSTLDNSFFGRQGIKVLFTNPSVWTKNFLKSWGDIGKELRGIDAIDAIKADLYSRENALNGNYKRGELAIGLKSEEAYPTEVLKKIPLLGRLAAASQSAYEGAALRMRGDLADRMFSRAERYGVDLTDPIQAKSLGKVVNSLTGRGGIGKLEVVGKELNAALFSIKFLKSNLDTLTAHAFDYKMSGYAKIQAAKNLGKILASTASILMIADTLWPGSVEFDPRSSDFGKIRIGDTRIDITGGMGSMLTLAARMATQSTKSSTSGKITKLNEDKFGAMTVEDVFINYFEGKASPALKAFIDVEMRGKDFSGNKPTVGSVTKNLITPLPITTLQELVENPNSADTLWAMILSELGLGVNTYSAKKR